MTENFSKSEFECKCGQCKIPEEVFLNLVKVANQLQLLRNHFGESISINSGYRCPEHNENIGGASKIVDGIKIQTSQHCKGTAADIVVKGWHSHQVYDEIDRLRTEGEILQGGLGKYDSFTHFDLRKYKARWDYSKK